MGFKICSFIFCGCREASVESVGTNKEQPSCSQSSEPKLNEAPDLLIPERQGPAERREHTPPQLKPRENHRMSSLYILSFSAHSQSKDSLQT